VVLGVKRPGVTIKQVFSVTLTGSTTGTITGSSSTVVNSPYDVCTPDDTWFIEITSTQANVDWTEVSIEAEYEDWVPHVTQRG
jgi:hypothetical protein